MNRPNTSHESGIFLSESDRKTTPPKHYGILLLDDDYTMMDFVVEALSEVFMLGEEQAVAAVLLMYHEGKGPCGIYAHDIAQTKQLQVMQWARAAGHPLQCAAGEIQRHDFSRIRKNFPTALQSGTLAAPRIRQPGTFAAGDD